MALAEGGRAFGLRRTFPRTELGTKTTDIKPTLYSEKEITRMMFSTPPPPELSEERNIETPVGTWSIDGDAPTFDLKSEAEIAKITKESVKQKFKRIAIKILNMS